jgi:hypothetical protein
MEIRIHPHAQERIIERGSCDAEVIETVIGGEKFPAKFDRVGFRRNFVFNNQWKGHWYSTKQVEAYAVQEQGWLVITAIVRYF